jgi:hypothetical protein
MFICFPMPRPITLDPPKTETQGIHSNDRRVKGKESCKVPLWLQCLGHYWIQYWSLSFSYLKPTYKPLQKPSATSNAMLSRWQDPLGLVILVERGAWNANFKLPWIWPYLCLGPHFPVLFVLRRITSASYRNELKYQILLWLLQLAKHRNQYSVASQVPFLQI